MKPIVLSHLVSIIFLAPSCSNSGPTSTAAAIETIVAPIPPSATPTLELIEPRVTPVAFLGPMPSDATGSDTLLRQYTKAGTSGETLVYSQELGMWMELHSAPGGIYLIDRRIAFYATSQDLLPILIEVDPALGWGENLIHVDQSNIYFTDRLRLVSFSSIVESELARRAGIDLHQKNSHQDVTALLDNIPRGLQTIQFRMPGDPHEYTWILNRGIRVWLVQDSILDQKSYASVYRLDNGDRVKIFAEDGILKYIVGTRSLDQKLQQDGILAKILSPMFEVLLAAKGQLPAEISSYYDLNYKRELPGDLSDMAGPVTVGGTPVPGFILLVGK